MSSRQSQTRASPRTDIIFACFVAYVFGVGVLTIAPPPLSRSNGLSGTNLIPLLNSIGCFVPDPGQPSTSLFCLQTIFGNLMMFLPLGFLLPLVSPRTHSLKTVLATAFLASLGIEAAQFAGSWLGSPRWTDVDDILLNVMGALVGYTILRMGQAVTRALVRWSASPTP
ncbi:MAG: VanZ family protein [Gemmatimonadota bacterium]|nr:VanZ family protein [Gemmatimonadota bacterium]